MPAVDSVLQGSLFIAESPASESASQSKLNLRLEPELHLKRQLSVFDAEVCLCAALCMGTFTRVTP